LLLLESNESLAIGGKTSLLRDSKRKQADAGRAGLTATETGINAMAKVEAFWQASPVGTSTL
jgi:hypothetical protein